MISVAHKLGGRGRPQQMFEVEGSVLSVESNKIHGEGFVARVRQDGRIVRSRSGFGTRSAARTWAYNELRVVAAQISGSVESGLAEG